MQNADTGSDGEAAAGETARQTTAYRQKYPARGNYMTAPLKRRPPAANWRRQVIVLSLAALVAFCLSFAAARFYGPDEKPADNGSAGQIEAQYPGIGQEVKGLADALGLTDKGRRIFYDHDPQIFASANHPDFLCARDIKIDRRVHIGGCWSASDGKIYLIRDDKLEAAAAHEFLHAVYYDAYVNGEHEALNVLITETFNQHADELRPLIGIYADLHTGTGEFGNLNRYNELHSFIGVKIAALPDELEAHYAEYFSNRRAVIKLDSD
ncbi:hypothetical protein F4X86_00720 [Candidatus Saccharibacteria bacterium]|nr:hypothetical protein [Candidatus Saccharibacteria bacterium]